MSSFFFKKKNYTQLSRKTYDKFSLSMLLFFGKQATVRSFINTKNSQSSLFLLYISRESHIYYIRVGINDHNHVVCSGGVLRLTRLVVFVGIVQFCATILFKRKVHQTYKYVKGYENGRKERKNNNRRRLIRIK